MPNVLERAARDIGRNIDREITNARSSVEDAINGTGYVTNKFDLMEKESEGTPKWTIAWSDDISETDVATGVVAAGISIYSGNAAPFLAWVRDLVNTTIDSLSSDAKNKFPEAIKGDVEQLAADVIKSAIQGKDAKSVFKEYDTVDFKAGAIQYSGSNKLAGNTVTKTWGLKPYIAFRIR